MSTPMGIRTIVFRKLCLTDGVIFWGIEFYKVLRLKLLGICVVGGRGHGVFYELWEPGFLGLIDV